MINGYTLGNLTRTVAYEANRNLVNTVTNTWNASTISAFDYTNDAAGRRTNREDSGSAFASTLTNTFGYNSKSEVTSANMRNGNSSYNFDQIGNRIQVSVPDEPNPLDYTTNALNQYEETGAPTLLSAYDLDGNLTNDGKGTTFEWNAENRMVRVTTPTKVIENTFDGQGRRVRKTVFDSNLQTLTSDTRYFYDGWNLIYEDDVLASTDTKYYVWGLDLSQSLQGAGGVGGLLLVKQGTSAWAPTFDANGNISEYIDLADGSVTSHIEYDAFGRKIVSTGSAPSTFGFSTKYEDVETGYLYYGFRFYDPVTGRWPNRDPIEERGGYNLYGFVANNSIQNIDILGNELVNPCPEGWEKYIDSRKEIQTETIDTGKYASWKFQKWLVFEQTKKSWHLSDPTDGQPGLGIGLGVNINQTLQFTETTVESVSIGVEYKIFTITGEWSEGKEKSHAVTASYEFPGIPDAEILVFLYWEKVNTELYMITGKLILGPGDGLKTHTLESFEGYTKKFAFVACKKCHKGNGK